MSPSPKHTSPRLSPTLLPLRPLRTCSRSCPSVIFPAPTLETWLSANPRCSTTTPSLTLVFSTSLTAPLVLGTSSHSSLTATPSTPAPRLPVQITHLVSSSSTPTRTLPSSAALSSITPASMATSFPATRVAWPLKLNWPKEGVASFLLAKPIITL
ncbi:hypothetical protein GQ44DRAFT_244499 [Phaeosphaeriaceae sp. PMI808]|nr:hypothetical protein GQ44DRAFT_244499 [Phaeosphaeriaceae sp. PMI808]